MNDAVDPVDIAIGARIRTRREELRITQAQLAAGAGVTFQQIQKYERGTNRVSASVLFKAGEAMSVPVSFFFDGLSGAPAEVAPTPRRDRSGEDTARLTARLGRPLQLQLIELLRVMVAEQRGDSQPE
jgi:transcriptional regulator with XRE-family HTH domain